MVVEPCCGGVTRAVDAVATETDRKGKVAVEKYVTGLMNTGLGTAPEADEPFIARLFEVGVMVGLTVEKMLAAFICDGANSANCLVNRPGGQPGTSSSSATLEKSRSLNTK